MPSHSRAKRVASGSVLISLVNWSYSLVTDGVKATPEINPLPVDKSVLIVTIQFRCIGKVREFRLFSYGYLILSIQQRSNTIPTTTSRHHDEGCFPHDAEDKLQLGQQCFEDYNFTFSEIFSAAASLWPGERRGLSSVSRYRAVLASFTCPSSNCAALRSPVS
jgi:hypothetical protein